MAFDPSQIDTFINDTTDGLSQIANVVSPPAVAPVTVTPIVYSTQAVDAYGNPIGSTQVGLDLPSLLLIGAAIVGVWWLLKR